MKKKAEPYIPPYKVSGKAMTLIAEIAAAIERYRIILEGPNGVRLRKINHIRTIRGTTAIEGKKDKLYIKHSRKKTKLITKLALEKEKSNWIPAS